MHKNPPKDLECLICVCNIDETNYNVYSGWTGQTINPASAATQPYGIMIYPGVQDNKIVGYSNNPAFNPYYTTNPEFNYQWVPCK